MFLSAQHIAYLAAAMLFILSLRGLSTQESARRGNLFGIVGMALAVAITCYALLSERSVAGLGESTGILAASIAVGALVGAVVAGRVAMTSMPELVAILHSFVGAAAVLVGLASYLEPEKSVHLPASGAPAGDVAHLVEIFAGVLIGAVTFTGSIIAFLKLRATIGSKPLLLPGRHALNALAIVACVVLAVLFVREPDPRGLQWLLAMTGIALLLGVHLVMAIGGGDMPVVVSLLNSYSGWAAAAAGFMLGNDLLIITGALVGSSGAILSTIMCRAMNRSIWNVVFGGFGATPAKKGKTAELVGKINATGAEDVAELLLASKRVIVIPGYGMAVAQAQHPVKDLTGALQKRGIDVKFAIHPVAGRLPGHMNVLLAEANVPYDIVKEMDEINDEFEHTDVVLIIGANDIVNPSALTDESSPIYGMPVLEAWKAARVVMLKRGMSAGYAGVDNAICYNENTLMLFGDAKDSITKLLAAVQAEAKAA
ncbi:MAG TPA: NAD(P)(+) transhydrogenase (Re/Si-specific) subunit beta [Polyangiaceae bacterium]|jgi:NAD(P) transhydrogenase subunit beta